MNRAATVALTPLSSLYGLAMKTRRALYRSGLLRIRELGAPVISVGNLTTGGTGKTPLVEWIARELARKKQRVCILTRGYGRAQPKQRVVVSDGNRILANPKQAGDEPFLLAERLLGQAAVISDANRASAARWALDNLQSNVFLLDDGFQNLRIARSLNIVTLDATNPWGNRGLLPAGILREPRAELSRADCVVITRADDTTRIDELAREIEKLNDARPVFRSHMTISGVRPVCAQVKDSKPAIRAEEIKSSSVAAFCAIGNPQAFFAQLRRDGYQLYNTKTFRDHHLYTQSNIDSIVRESMANGAQILLTTAKDEVKLRSLAFALPCYAMDIAIDIEDKDKLITLIDEALEQSDR